MEHKKLNKNAPKAWVIGRFISLLIFLTIYLVGVYVFLTPIVEDNILKILIHIFSAFFVFSGLILTFGFPLIEFKEWSYLIKDDKVELKYGVFIRKKVIIPISRLQFIDIKHGPIYKMFSLSSVILHTAGFSVHKIPALTNKEANSIVQNLMAIIEAEKDNA